MSVPVIVPDDTTQRKPESSEHAASSLATILRRNQRVRLVRFAEVDGCRGHYLLNAKVLATRLEPNGVLVKVRVAAPASGGRFQVWDEWVSSEELIPRDRLDPVVDELC